MRFRSATAVSVVSSGGAEPVIESFVVAKQEFAGRWEYVLDQAIFTAPPHDSWSGAALVDSDGRLCGLGSLVIQGFEVNGTMSTVNMFVPIELLVPDHRRDLRERPALVAAAAVARHAGARRSAGHDRRRRVSQLSCGQSRTAARRRDRRHQRSPGRRPCEHVSPDLGLGQRRHRSAAAE